MAIPQKPSELALPGRSRVPQELRARISAAAALGIGLALGAESARATATSVRETAPKLEIVSFTGQIQVKMPYSARGLAPKGLTPSIPPGSEVVVLAGTALFQSADTFIRAAAGDSFIFHVPLPSGGSARPILLAAVGDKTALDLEIGDTRAVLRSGTAVAIRSDGPGKARFEVAMGTVVVSMPDRIASLGPGMWVESAVRSGQPPAPQGPPAAVAEGPVVGEAERKELRSAPGPVAAPGVSTRPAPGAPPSEPTPAIVDPDERFRDAPNAGPGGTSSRGVTSPVEMPQKVEAAARPTHVQRVKIVAGACLALGLLVAFALFRRSER